MKNKAMSKTRIILLIISILIILAFAILIYFIFFHNPSPKNTVLLPNPLINLTDEQAIEQFDESFILYLLYSIEASKLHNPPLSSDTPKVEMRVSDYIYNAEVKKGVISIVRGSIEKKDIIILTSKQEVVKMLRNKNYISTSFRNSLSNVELVAGKTRLATKGYIGLYTKLTGDDIEVDGEE